MEKENILREKIAASCYVLAKEGHADGLLGHVSARLGADTFLMKPRGFGLEEVGAEDMVILDFEGNKVSGKHPPHHEYPIHSEIFRARPDVHCVIHTHPMYSIAFAATGEDLKPVSHEACYFWPGVPRFTQMTDLVVTKEHGRLLAECLGDKLAVLMGSHGIAVAAKSIEIATLLAIYLEKAAQIQLMVMHRQNFFYTSDEEAAAKQKRFLSMADFTLTQQWKYYLRKWGRKDPEASPMP